MKMLPHQRRLKDLRTANASIERIKEEAAQTAIMTLYIMLLYTMYFHYGWKRKRLSRVLMQFRGIYEAIINGDRTLGQLAEELRHDTGVDIDIKTGQAKIAEVSENKKKR